MKKRKTIKFSELKRLSVINSDRIPAAIAVGGKRLQWVGISWIEIGPAQGDETIVQEG